MTTSPLVDAADLQRLLARADSDSLRLRLLDARPGEAGREAFESGHLPGARHVDLDRDLAAIDDPARGGRHPLPAPTVFAATLSRLGIGAEDLVVVYDDAAAANAAARLWWMLRSIGIERAAVLDGGIAAAIRQGIPLERGSAPAPAPATPLAAPRWHWPTADADEVAAAARDPRRVVIDVRSRERYLGETEPFDPVAGHVPGARNLPFTESLGQGGRFRSPDELRAHFASRLGAAGTRLDRAIVHCGSGVTACHTVLAMEAAGLPRPKLYVGSWSEWCRSGRPIATGEEHDGR